MSDKRKSGSLRQVTAYLEDETYHRLHDISDKFNVSLAKVIRIALEVGLEKYFSQIQYIDHEQGEKIQEILLKILSTKQEILNNIRRIGVNYNQEIILKNLEKKYRDATNNAHGMTAAEKIYVIRNYTKIKDETNHMYFDINEFEDLLARYEKTSKEEDELLCRILR